MRVYKCDACEHTDDCSLPITTSMLVETDDTDEDDDPVYEQREFEFCTLNCLATWAMREALEHNEVTS